MVHLTHSETVWDTCVSFSSCWSHAGLAEAIHKAFPCQTSCTPHTWAKRVRVLCLHDPQVLTSFFISPIPQNSLPETCHSPLSNTTTLHIPCQVYFQTFFPTLHTYTVHVWIDYTVTVHVWTILIDWPVLRGVLLQNFVRCSVRTYGIKSVCWERDGSIWRKSGLARHRNIPRYGVSHFGTIPLLYWWQ